MIQLPKDVFFCLSGFAFKRTLHLKKRRKGVRKTANQMHSNFNGFEFQGKKKDNVSKLEILASRFHL